MLKWAYSPLGKTSFRKKNPSLMDKYEYQKAKASFYQLMYWLTVPGLIIGFAVASAR